MATKTYRLKPILQAQHRRSVLPWYFDLSGKGLFLLVILAASLLALLALAQTGRVVSVGYHLKDLEMREEELLWEQEQLLQQIADACDPADLEQWAEENGMMLLEPGDIMFLQIPTEIKPQVHVPSRMASEP